jgi:acyl-CoA synthetase (AMP-forming)/AMP-acid ligase II
MRSDRTHAPRSGRLRLLLDRRLGAGNFLQRACAANPARHRPFLFAQERLEGAPSTRVVAYSLDLLVETTRRYAAWYYGAGARPGDPVGVYLAEGVASFLHYLALTSIGAIPVLVNGRMPASAATAYLRQVGVVGLVSQESLVHDLRRGERDGLRPLLFDAGAEEVSRAAVSTCRLPDRHPYEHEAGELVMLCHSSGTTGRPKAVMFAHRQFFLGKRHRLLTFPASPDDRLLSALPHSHSAGISYLMTATLLGLPTFVMAESGGAATEEAMRSFRPTTVVGFAQTFAELATRDLSPDAARTVHTWINTGDAAHEAHIRALVGLGCRPGLAQPRPGSRFIDGLGSSEMGMALFRRVSEPGTTLYRRCIGKPIGLVRAAAVLDDDGRPVGPHAVGRLGVKSPTLTPGYWNDTGLTVRSHCRGYWLTGDLVRRDDEGRFFHLDRIPDAILTRHATVYSLPMEEALLNACSSVADCAVIAVPEHEHTDERTPVAVVRPKDRLEDVDGSALLTAANRALTDLRMATLAAVIVARTDDDFPTGPTGKVLKRVLRNRYASLLASDARCAGDASAADAMATR